MSITTLLRQVRESSGVGRDERAPLWRYRVDEATMDELQRLLRVAFATGDHEPGHVAAAFCLFAATHFCRTHEGGPWSWSPIFEATGWPHGVGARLYDMVRRGLDHWRCGDVLVRKDRSYYHRTLACQGGLPLRLLTGENANGLSEYFTRLLRAAEEYEQPAHELAPLLDRSLPSTLRNDLVHELAATLVDAIVALRRSTSDDEDPVAALDARNPEWRARVPLRIDDTVADRLLTVLLRAPRSSGRAQRADPIEIRLVLRTTGTSFAFERAAILEPAVAESALASMLGLQDLPPFVHLALLLPDGTRRWVATATRYQGTDRFALRPTTPPRPIHRGPGLFGAVRVVASVGAEDIGIAEVTGGAPIADDLPWVLEGGRLREHNAVRAFGSARAAGDAMLLVLPCEGALASDETATVTAIAEGLEGGRRLVQLSGTATWTNGDDRCRFATSAREDETSPFSLRGRLRTFGFAGAEVWMGPPKLVRLHDGCQRSFPSDRVEWRPERERDWRGGLENAHGNVLLRVREEGETIFRTRATIVPSDLTVERATPARGAGVLTVASAHLRGLRATLAEGLIAESRPLAPGRFSVELKTAEAPPTTVQLRLLLREGAEATLDVACPIQFRRFVGFDGRSLPANELRAADRLGTVRARSIEDRHERISMEGRVTISVNGRVDRGEWHLLAELPDRGHHLYELPLDRVERSVATMLASSPCLDASVELRMTALGGTPRDASPSLHVGRYDTQLEPVRGPDGTPRSVRLSEASVALLGPQGLDRIQVDARPLDRPDEPPVPFGRVGQSEWEIPAGLTPGPWLVLGWQDDWARLRPLLLTIRATTAETVETLDELRAAVRIEDSTRRTEALDQLLVTMANDYGHERWATVLSFARTLGTLPATTFDVIRRVAARPNAAVVFALHTHDLPAAWSSLEELPFLWAALPLRSWVRGARRLHDWIRATPAVTELYGSPAAATSALLGEPLGALQRRAPFLEIVRAVVSLSLPGLDAEALGRIAAYAAIGHQQWEPAAAQMRARSATRRWPEPALDDYVAQRAVSLARRFSCAPSRPFEEAVLLAPALVAAVSVLGETLPEEALFAVRRVADFDPDWFQHAHCLSLAGMIAAELARDPEAFDVTH
ncbi:MAG: STY4851/ECs_5259 family protein [Sandaracinaceae bacterium]|nr:STY4851/ECs_5259 family protein [Sandaracinaceae bacterium]